MLNFRLVLSVFVSVSVLSGQAAFAYSGDLSGTTKSRPSVVAIVKVDGNRAVCQQTVDGYQLVQPAVPRCGDEQSVKVLNQSLSGGSTRTAWLTHAGAAIGGCLYGAGGFFLGTSIESGYMKGRATAAGAGVGTLGSAGLLLLVGSTVSDPSGHFTAGAIGAVICGGTLTYLVYQAQH